MRLLVIFSIAALAFAGPGAASTTDEVTPFEGSFTNPCTGETFDAQGTVLHQLRSDTLHGGATALTVESFEFQHVEGTTETGVRYEVPNENTLRQAVFAD